MTQYYKFLSPEGAAIYGRGSWYLPHGKRPGKWMPSIKDIKLCASGYHVCEAKDLVAWIGPEAWLVEGRGESIVGNNKIVFQQGRLLKRLNWDDKVARLFAADCAARVLHNFEKVHPEDTRPREAIVAARQHARGEIGDAAWDAADAAGAAAQAAARAAADAAAWDAAWGAAWDAAGDAADAARDAARAAADAAARDAADAAAWDVAWDAAVAAGAAARAAAWAAARGAADAAARGAAAERSWQIKRLLDYLHDRVKRDTPFWKVRKP